ncbi:MAG: hypothetical protein MJE68_13210 [Proteobacteria bacterium]|nr:hypothetical protein [Pseudomonadota bacterium]
MGGWKQDLTTHFRLFNCLPAQNGRIRQVNEAEKQMTNGVLSAKIKQYATMLV